MARSQSAPRGLGTAEMDQIADLVHAVLANTRPGDTPSGGPGRNAHKDGRPPQT